MFYQGSIEMSSNPVQEMAEGLLAEMQRAFIETINGSRQLTENEFHAHVQCYIKAKPHLSKQFEVQWCTALLRMVDFDEVRHGGGNAAETLQCFVEIMMKSE
jgi:hypothetical protein